jgi:hypothetical protein
MAEQRLGADGPQHTLFWPFVGLFPVGRRSSPALALFHGKEHPVPIRTATVHDAAAIAKVHVESWRTTYQGIDRPRRLRPGRNRPGYGPTG